jgi:lipopolysaccharide transport system permease protein
LVLYTFFAETLSGAAASITSHPSYVKRIVFPLELLPATKLGAALVHAGIGFALLLGATLVMTHRLPTTIVYLPVVLLPLVVWALGLAWFVGSLAVYLRDLQQLLAVALQVLLYLTPIFYPLAAVPPRFRGFTAMNPLTAVVESARRVLLWNEEPLWRELLWVTLAGFVVLQLGFVWFMKTKKGFADVV